MIEIDTDDMLKIRVCINFYCFVSDLIWICADSY